jgi:hypothetical protein
MSLALWRKFNNRQRSQRDAFRCLHSHGHRPTRHLRLSELLSDPNLKPPRSHWSFRQRKRCLVQFGLEFTVSAVIGCISGVARFPTSHVSRELWATSRWSDRKRPGANKSFRVFNVLSERKYFLSQMSNSGRMGIRLNLRYRCINTLPKFCEIQ